MEKHIKTMLRGMTAQELAAACTYVRSGWRNLFTEELCRRARLLQPYHSAYEDRNARKVVDRAAKSFGIRLIYSNPRN